MRPTAKSVTVGIVTRNRFDSLVRCVRSASLISEFVKEVIVVDDHSDEPVESPLREALGGDLARPLTVVRQEQNYGPIVARNMLARLASTDYLLSLDDDALILDARAIEKALGVIARDAKVGAVAFAQADGSGEPWPALMQPSPADYACYVTAYIGFATLLRRQAFLALGGYRDHFYFYGEEKEYCLRLLESGSHVIYLPDAKVGHLPDPSGRVQQKYLRYVARNDCLGAMYNQPLPLVLAHIPARFYGYLRMKRQGQVNDPGGLRWLAGELVASLPRVWRERRAVSWATLGRWRELKKMRPAYNLDEGTPV